MLPRIDYLEANEIVAQQKAAIYEEIKKISNNAHSVFPGLDIFKDAETKKPIHPRKIPGLGKRFVKLHAHGPSRSWLVS